MNWGGGVVLTHWCPVFPLQVCSPQAGRPSPQSASCPPPRRAPKKFNKKCKRAEKVKVVPTLPRAAKQGWKIKQGGNTEIIGVNDFLKAQEVSKEKALTK